MQVFTLDTPHGWFNLRCEDRLAKEAHGLLALFRDKGSIPDHITDAMFLDGCWIYLVRRDSEWIATGPDFYHPDCPSTDVTEDVTRCLEIDSAQRTLFARLGVQEADRPTSQATVAVAPGSLGGERLFMTRPPVDHMFQFSGWYVGPDKDDPPIHGVVDTTRLEYMQLCRLAQRRPALMPAVALPEGWVVEVRGEEVVDAWFEADPDAWREYVPPPKPRIIVKKQALPSVSDVSTEELIARLDAWLQEYRPDYYAVLLPGATDEQLASVERELALALPEDVKAFYRWRNGQNSKSYDSLHWNWMFMSLERSSDDSQMLSHLKEIGEFPTALWWHSGWFPFLDSGSGNHLCIDTQGALDGVPGEVLFFDHADAGRTVEHQSFRKWLETLVALWEAGECTFEDEYAVSPEGHGHYLEFVAAINPGYPKDVDSDQGVTDLHEDQPVPVTTAASSKQMRPEEQHKRSGGCALVLALLVVSCLMRAWLAWL
jgi:cell wall assembly regulator SMI1